MRLRVLESGNWTVTAIEEANGAGEYSCRLVESFDELGANHQKPLAGLFDLFEKFAVHGRKMLHDGICHEVDENEKIFEFIKGDLRVLWFYGNGNKVVICSHCFVKRGRKTPKPEKNVAIDLKTRYFELVQRDVRIEMIDD